jgi:hypothetical protein
MDTGSRGIVVATTARAVADATLPGATDGIGLACLAWVLA